MTLGLITVLILTFCQVDRFLESNLSSGQISPGLRSMPLAEIFVLAGFYLIYTIEEVTHFTIDRYAANTGLAGHGHQHQGEVTTMLAGETDLASDRSK